MQINELYEVYQYGVTCLALCGLLILAAYSLWESPFGRAGRDAVSNAWSAFRRTDAVGKVLLSVFVIGMAQFGSTKGGFWSKVMSGGGDEPLLVSGIYTAVSNDVVDVDGVTVTNKIPLVRVEWFGEGGSEETPVSIRAAETNAWTQLEKISPRVFMDDVTNVLEFVSTDNFDNIAYWWFGVDLPAIVITTEGIEIRDFIVTSEETITFILRRAERDGVCDSSQVGRRFWCGLGGGRLSPANYGQILSWSGEMFTVDRTYDWQVITVIEEGGNE